MEIGIYSVSKDATQLSQPRSNLGVGCGMAGPYGKEEGASSTMVGSLGLMENAFLAFVEDVFLGLVTLQGFRDAISTSSR